ncbi:MAG: bifunctional pyr operon transcriptional regulator/uracil phosphoribosyltransferase PyrR [Ruminococcaceae bacterium]|nr:bifunctional pyr operon transcriptional regulator/uracil phosphoribosyltransferase PyrR [Oscillospiraceae bacterium]
MEKILMTSEAMGRTFSRLAHEVIEKNEDLDNVVFIGVLRRGVPIAREIAKKIYDFCGKQIRVGTLDITLYRDDVGEIGDFPDVKAHSIDFDIHEKRVILVDDVIFTGRTVRAAIEAIFDIARPKCIQLLAFVDRGHRELPIKPDYVGKNVPTAISEKVLVQIADYDGETQVVLRGA